MASPHVTGAAALVKAARPYFTPAEVKEALQYLGTLDWKVTSDPDSQHEKLLDVSKLGPRGDFGVSVSGLPTVSTHGRHDHVPGLAVARRHDVRADLAPIGPPAARGPGDVRHEEPVRLRRPVRDGARPGVGRAGSRDLSPGDRRRRARQDPRGDGNVRGDRDARLDATDQGCAAERRRRRGAAGAPAT